MVLESGWQTLGPDLTEDDEALSSMVLEVHRSLLEGPLAGDPSLNLALPIQPRALRRIEDWRVLLLLTPWMFARLLFPDRPLDIDIPPGWSAGERSDADYLVLGPMLSLELLGQVQRAHLNYHSRLGHYLLQPICLDLERYADPEAVFEDWNQVIRTRDENMEQARRDCAMQKEISRRELFRRLKPGA
ncbi:[NiFe]-hydrogenase assembly chaperone HybE [Imhoffiella purpurea]|uniref:Uncharacterized protein n=1 Tax=Imhoffiella purpurea TaxID=1249627 RepID=W9VDP9_9GAMM|nr:[NiFe]-hydrogenase assembly chaperone HybE [Imhoffiella purpurea]EXJ14172.1 hypothetical protein D779_2843 [Imhoffiella purpurea]